MTLKWAILEQLRHPPKAFESVVKKHFYLKRDEILSQVKKWIDEMQKTVDENSESAERINIKNSLVAIKVWFFQLLLITKIKMFFTEKLRVIERRTL